MTQPLIDGDILNCPDGYELRTMKNGDHEVFSFFSDRLLKPYIGPNGYKYVTFRDGRRQYIHRLVCNLYHDKIDGKEYVNHKDGNKLNNHPNNLEWCTCSENTKHSHDHLSRKKIQSYYHPNRTLSDEEILDIFHSVEPQRIIAERYSTSARTVFNIRKGIRHSRVTGKEVVCPTFNR